MPPKQRASIPVRPELYRAMAVLPDAFQDDTTLVHEVPVSAKCVTFTFSLQANPDQGQVNFAEHILYWQALDPTDASILSRATLASGNDFDPATCTLPVCLGVWQSPSIDVPDIVLRYDLTFPIPAGKNGVLLQSLNTGDRDNPASLRVLVAFSGSYVGT